MACGCCDEGNFKEFERWSSTGLQAAVLPETDLVEGGTNARRREPSTGVLDGRQGHGGQVRGFG